jgi:hypothetical protein
MKKMLVCLAVLAGGVAAHAQDSKWRFFAGLGAANGGETITNGVIVIRGTTQQVPFDIAPGVGIQKRIGADYRIADRFTLQGSIGHSSSEPTGDNGSYDFTVVPVEFMGFVDVVAGFRLGAGLRISSAELRGAGVVANDPTIGTFKSSGGTVFEAQYLFSSTEGRTGKSVPQFGVSLRSVTEKFTHTLGELNGNHYEVGIAVYY